MMRMMRWFAGVVLAALLCEALFVPALAGATDMTADDVFALEQRLFELGYLNGEYNDTFDADTEQAIESFQQANGMDVTGMLDAETMERLTGDSALSRQDYLRRFTNAYAQMTPLKNGDVNNDVLAMQRKLKEYGYFSGETDGMFGQATQMAVESFQMVNGLPVTGVADGAMLMRLMADSPITWPGYLSEMSAGAGDSGLNVYVLQKRLARMGYFQGECTGSYGDLTRQAVIRFQADNGLEQTGSADAATWAAIYSGAAELSEPSNGLQVGDYGEDVQKLQLRLTELGYGTLEGDGKFSFETETALRLFQMASGLPATGVADTAALTALEADSAVSLQDAEVQESFQTLLDVADESTQQSIAAAADRVLGVAFDTSGEGKYPGYALVQYACVAAGLPITRPEDLIRMASQQLESPDDATAGDILAFQSESGEDVTIHLAIGVGDGKIIYTTEKGGWAIMGFMDQLESTNIYRWDAAAMEE